MRFDIPKEVLIETEGTKVGQINGLAVMQLGDFAFGKPSRITARVRTADDIIGSALHSLSAGRKYCAELILFESLLSGGSYE